MKLTINNESLFFLAGDAGHLTTLLSHLLPYDPGVKIGDRLKDGLKEYRLLLVAAEEALKHLELGNLDSFDPLVGENSCQIRAVKLALTLSSCTFNTKQLLEQVIQSRSKIDQALTNFLRINKQKTSLKHFLENDKCDVQITPVEKYLIKSFILTKTKVLKSLHTSKPLVKNDITDTKKIKEFSEVGSLFAKNFVAHLRREMSSSSVKFIQQITKQLCPSNTDTKMVSHEFLIDHSGLHCIPCYWSTKIAMEQAIHHGTPIVMIVEQKAKDHDYKIMNKTTLFFKLTSEGHKTICISELDPESPAIILQGSTCRDLKDLPNEETWLQELLANDPVELVLAYAAAHRQYPDELKDHIFSQIVDEGYNYHRTKAYEWGCSLENPSLFFLAHAYCDKIKNIKISREA